MTITPRKCHFTGAALGVEDSHYLDKTFTFVLAQREALFQSKQ
jgi:hypothetical protein